MKNVTNFKYFSLFMNEINRHKKTIKEKDIVKKINDNKIKC